MLQHYLTGFKRYALYEKEITPKVTRSIIRSVAHFFDSTGVAHLQDANTELIRNYLYEQKEKRLWTAKTFRNRRQQLKTFFEFCLLHDYTGENPVNKIGKPKLAKTLPRFIDAKDTALIVAHTELYPWRYDIERIRNRAIISTFLLLFNYDCHYLSFLFWFKHSNIINKEMRYANQNRDHN